MDLVLAFLARATLGAIFGVILVQALAALLGAIVTIGGPVAFMLLTPPATDEPHIGGQSFLSAMFLSAIFAWSFGPLPAAISSAATLSSRRLVAASTGPLASLAIAYYHTRRGDTEATALIALVTSVGSIISAVVLHFASRALARLFKGKGIAPYILGIITGRAIN